MRKFLLFSLLLFMFVGLQAQRQKLSLHGENDLFSLISTRSTDLVVQKNLSELQFVNIESKRGEFSRILAPGCSKVFSKGNPELPVVSKLIEIPFGAKVNVNIIGYSEEIVDLNKLGIQKIAPAQLSVSKSANSDKIPFYYNKKAYKTNSFGKDDIAIVEEAGIMRSVRLGRLEIRPFKYNPVTNQLKIYSHIEVQISFKDADLTKTEQIKNKYQSLAFEPMYKSIINHISNSKQYITDNPITYVIVSDRMFESQLQPFIQWKKQKGFNVIIGYTDSIGTTTETIKAYLQNLYENPVTTAPSFVLFVGDNQQIPAWAGSSGSHVTDLRYCEYTGDDIPEVFYGRFSAQTTAQLQSQIDKTLMYEKYQMSDPSYLSQSLLVAGDDEGNEDIFGNGAMWYGDTYYFNSSNNITDHLFLQDPPDGNDAIHDSIIANVNKGLAFGNYTAHCSPAGWASPSFTTSDVPGLNNNEKYGLLVGNCCLSNKFDESECFGEALLRGVNKGAIGYIGGSNSTYWDEDYWWGTGYIATPVTEPTYENTGVGAYDGMFHNKANEQGNTASWFTTQGQTVQCGDLAVEASPSTRKQYYWEIYHLMGDPSVTNYMGIPQEQTVVASPTVLLIGMTSLTITTSPYAYVALSMNGSLLDFAVANESGVASLSFDALTSVGDADLVITAQNYQPYIGTISVSPADEPYVVLNGYTLSSNANYGDSVKISVALENVANAGSGYDAGTVVAKITSTDQYVTISDSTETYGSIIAGDTLSITDAFAFVIANNVPDQHSIKFTLTVTGVDAKYTWESQFSIKANAPKLTIGTLNVNDVTLGNNDGILDPNENATLEINITNDGHADILAVNNILSITNGSEYLTITGIDTVLIDSLSAGVTKKAIFAVHADSLTPLGTSVDLKINTKGGSETQYVDSTNKQIIIGFIPEYCASGSTNDGDSEIDEVVFGSISNNTASTCASYSDFTNDTSLTGDFMIGATYQMSLTLGTCDGNYSKAAKVYVDWNYDGDFDDENEMVWETEVSTDPTTSTHEITIPATANVGQKYMRIVCNEAETSISACGTFSYGETEDYKINLTPPEVPIANFEANPLSTTVGMDIQFTDLTENAPTTWQWTIIPGTADTDYEYINNTSETSKNPKVKFNTANTYSISLVASNMVGADTASKTDYITINAITAVPDADFTVDDTSLYPNDIVHFTDMSNNTPTSWTWAITPGVAGTDYEFVDSSTSNSQNPAIKFIVPGNYTVSLTASNIIGASTPMVKTDLITVNAIFLMNNGSVSTCSGTFFDTGGPDNDYSGSESLTYTINPATTGSMTQVNFTEFDVESNSSGGCYDELTIYNGSSTSAPEIGTYCTNSAPTTISASNMSGALTFAFNSDGSVVKSGWAADISCVSAYEVTFNVTDGTNTIENATITINSESIVTNASGVATANLPDGTYNYTVSASGYNNATGSIVIAGGEISENVTLTLIPATYVVTFKVTGDETPAQGALITIGSVNITTNSSGVATTNLTAGQYSYIIVLSGYGDITGNFEVIDDSVTITVDMVGMQSVSTSGISIYPNPNNGSFTLDVTGTYDVQIMNSIGKVVYTTKVTNKQVLSMNNINEGIYFIRLIKNNQIITKQFIVKK